MQCILKILMENNYNNLDFLNVSNLLGELDFLEPVVLVRLNEIGVNASYTKISVSGTKLAVSRTHMTSV